MERDIKDIPGYSLFKTSVEKDRLASLLVFIKEFIPEEEIKYIVPNMAKDPSGKKMITGFFVFLNTVLFEFRNFLNALDFDYARYDFIKNIRFDMKNFGNDNLPKEDSMLTLKIFHSQEAGFSSIITVFDSEACNYVYKFLKILREFLR